MTDILNGKITKTIFQLAWPPMIGMILHTMFNIVDTIFVGRISGEAIAAVSMAFPVMFLAIALANGVGIGVTSLISRSIGSKNPERANSAANHSLLISAVISIIFTAIILPLLKPLYILMGANGGVLPLAVNYTQWIMGSSILIFLSIAYQGMLNGEGAMKTHLKFVSLAIILNIILDPIFIFILGLGVEGAAIATVISRLVGLIAIAYYFYRQRSSIKISFSGFRFDFSIVKQILRVGVPSSADLLIMPLGQMLLIKIASLFGAMAIAAYGVGFKLLGVAFMPALGIGTAVITMVGQNVGAHKFERAEKATWRAALLSFLIMEFIGCMFFLFPEVFVRIFTSEPEIVMYTASLLKIHGLFIGFSAISISLGSAFLGAGKAVPAMVMTLMRVLVITVPAAFILAVLMDVGVDGIWWSYPISTVITSLMAVIWFKLGTWKRGKHIPQNVEPTAY